MHRIRSSRCLAWCRISLYGSAASLRAARYFLRTSSYVCFAVSRSAVYVASYSACLAIPAARQATTSMERGSQACSVGGQPSSSSLELAVPVVLAGFVGRHGGSLSVGAGRVSAALCHRNVAGSVDHAGRRSDDVVTAAPNHGGVAGYQALEAAGASIVELLDRKFADVPEAITAHLQAFLASSNELKTLRTNTGQIISQPAISVYCYRVTVDKETRPGWSAVGSVDGVPRIPLRMHLLVAAWGDSAAEELRWIGLAAQILESNSILTGVQLLPVQVHGVPFSPWQPGDAVQVVTDDLALGVDERGVPGADHGVPTHGAVHRAGDLPRGTGAAHARAGVAGRGPAGADRLMTVETSIGTANVLHRLAVAVECMDPLTERLVADPGSGRSGAPAHTVPPGA